jgi:hypothetical protein
MNTKAIAWIIVAIVVIGGGWYLISQYGKAATLGHEGQHATASDPVMVGTWKSTDDASFTRTFNDDGTVVDAYTGDASATETGTFTTVDPLKEPAGAFDTVSPESLAGMTVLKLSFPKSGVMYFGVQSETESSLNLIYIGRGNTLSFVKVK